ncbi:hydantoinase/dihydropyrimidinase, partial [Kipferlia bialata]
VKADVLIEGEKIVRVAPSIEATSDMEVVDCEGQYIMPGGIDPHTHLNMPFMGTNVCDGFESGTAAAAAGGTTSIIDFALGPNKAPGSYTDALKTWKSWAAGKALVDYGFHMAVTRWDEQVKEEMAQLVEEGVNSFKMFMAYKGALMVNDSEFISILEHARDLGALPSVHAENGDIVAHLQGYLHSKGVTTPAGHVQSRPPSVETEATTRAVTLATQLRCPLMVVHVTTEGSIRAIREAREAGFPVFGEATCLHLARTEKEYYTDDWAHAAHHVLSPPLRPQRDQDALWDAVRSDVIEHTVTDHACFTTEQKKMGKDCFARIPNGVAGLWERMMVLWELGVVAGQITRKQFVQQASYNTARAYNLLGRKGEVKVGCDADIVVWNPNGKQTLSAE